MYTPDVGRCAVHAQKTHNTCTALFPRNSDRTKSQQGLMVYFSRQVCTGGWGWGDRGVLVKKACAVVVHRCCTVLAPRGKCPCVADLFSDFLQSGVIEVCEGAFHRKYHSVVDRPRFLHVRASFSVRLFLFLSRHPPIWVVCLSHGILGFI